MTSRLSSDQSLTKVQITSLVGGGSFKAGIDADLERQFLGLVGAINVFGARGDAAADWDARPAGDATLDLSVNPIEVAGFRGGFGHRIANHHDHRCHV